MTQTTNKNAYIAMGMRIASAMLSVTRDEIRLACGELSSSEMRTVLAILEWQRSAIIRKAEEMCKNTQDASKL